jgi:hypothetical protein
MAAKIKEISCIYVTRQKEAGQSVLSMWAYDFADPRDITSIYLKKSRRYRLVGKND